MATQLALRSQPTGGVKLTDGGIFRNLVVVEIALGQLARPPQPTVAATLSVRLNVFPLRNRTWCLVVAMIGA